MGMITIFLTNSSLQVGEIGIPELVYLSTDIPSVIYYTLDGSVPTSMSTVYTNGITLPLDVPKVILNAFATNGFEVSQITSFEFDEVNPQNYFGDGITNVPANPGILNYFPFGGYDYSQVFQYLNNTNGTVYNADNPSVFYNGCDENGNPNNPSNLLYTEDNYEIVYNEQDSTAQYELDGIGRRPSIFDFTNKNIKFSIQKKSTVTSTNDFSPRFARDAFVRYQDCSQLDATTPFDYNFSAQTSVDVFREKNVSRIYGNGLENQPPTMFLINSFYIASKNVINYYYLDTINQRYIISSVPVAPADATPESLRTIVPMYDRKRGPYVFPGYPTILFPRRKLQ